MIRKKEPQNFLEFVPYPKPEIRTKEGDAGHIEVLIKHHGFFPWIAQHFFRKPKESAIELDDLSDFVWRQMDGERNVETLAEAVHQQFGEKAEPLLDRLVLFFRILHQHDMIKLDPPQSSL